jgi:Zn-dependent protease with chaperone function
MTKKMLAGICPQEWEHPSDRTALNALRRLPGLDVVIKTLLGNTSERSLRLFFLASSVRVTDKQFSRVRDIAKDVNNHFGIKQAPEVFVTQSPFLNAGAVGYKTPFIVLNSSIVESMDEEELAGVYAHELGHIMSGHVLYKTILRLLVHISFISFSVPLSGPALMAVIIALGEWDRNSELSSDRAGLLYTQDLRVNQTTLMKMAGGRKIGRMDLDEFRNQAKEYVESNGVLDQLFKLLNLLDVSHPFATLRVVELERWAETEDYKRIVSLGEFKTTPHMNHLTDIKDVSVSYGSGIRKSFRFDKANQ